MFKKKKKETVIVRILYKSGQHFDFECEDFAVSGTAEAIKLVKWTRTDGVIHPIWIGVENIEAVWQIA